MNFKFSDSAKDPNSLSEMEKESSFLESSFVSGICEDQSPLVSSVHFTSTPSCLRKKHSDLKLPDCSVSMDDSGFDDGSLSSERNSPDEFPTNLTANRFNDFANDDEDEGFSDVSTASTGCSGNDNTKADESSQSPHSDVSSFGASLSTPSNTASQPTVNNEFDDSKVSQEADRVDGPTSKSDPDPELDLSRVFNAKLSLSNLNAASIAFAWRREFSVARKVITVMEYNDRLLEVLKHFAPANINCLIGRKMGLEQVDVVAELFFRNVLCVLQTIFNYLNDQDLFTMTAVSPQWKTAVKSISFVRYKKLKRKQQNHSTEKTDETGNARKTASRSSSSSLTLDPINIKPHTELMAESKNTVPAQVPDRMQLFWEEASKLRNHESLRKCPRCQHPSRFDGLQERAWCQNVRCSFDFCVRCFLQFHSSRECGKGTSYYRAACRENKISSKQSRQNLRRL